MIAALPKKQSTPQCCQRSKSAVPKCLGVGPNAYLTSCDIQEKYSPLKPAHLFSEFQEMLFPPLCTGFISKSLQLQLLCHPQLFVLPCSCQGSSAGELKVNVRGQDTPKYFKHSAPKHLKGKVCHSTAPWETRVLPYSQGNDQGGTNSPNPEKVWASIRCQMFMLQQQHRKSCGKNKCNNRLLIKIKALIPLKFDNI